MTIRTFLAGTAGATVICFLAWFAVITAFDPFKAGIIGFILFYFSLFLWLSGVFLLAGFYLRLAAKPGTMPFILITVSGRQAVFLSLFINILLILKGLKMINLFNAGFLSVAIIFLEAYFNSRKYGNLR